MDCHVPDDLNDHCYRTKYEFIGEDEELGKRWFDMMSELHAPSQWLDCCWFVGVPLYIEGRGFEVDILKRPFLSPALFNGDYDAYKNLLDHTLEEGDYLMSSSMKTGQHWVYEIMCMLLAGKATYTAQGKEASWIDIVPIEQMYQEHEKPRVLSTHITPGWLPEGFL